MEHIYHGGVMCSYDWYILEEFPWKTSFLQFDKLGHQLKVL